MRQVARSEACQSWLGCQQYGNLVYAGPKTGYAQIAISKAAWQTGNKAVLFLQSFDSRETSMTARAKKYGAEIRYRKDNLKNISNEAQDYVSKNGGRIVEFGLDQEEICHLIRDNFAAEVAITDFPVPVKRLWLVAGSCVLLKQLYQVFPNTQFLVVQVGMPIWADIIAGEEHRTTVYKSLLTFPTPTTILPPYPSISTYDAKLWQFVLEHGQDGDYILNVGKE